MVLKHKSSHVEVALGERPCDVFSTSKSLLTISMRVVAVVDD